MSIRRACFFILLVLLLPAGCVSLKEHTALEKKLADARLQAAQNDARLKSTQAELLHANQRSRQLETELQNATQIGDKCMRSLVELQSRQVYLQNINRQLAKSTQQLKVDLAKKKSIIQLQEKVIRVLDDTKKTIENSLKDQIAAQDIEVVKMEDRLKVVFLDKILFDSGSVEINTRGKNLLRVLAASIRDQKNQSIVVEGFTDNVPLRPTLKKRFPSNWELSTARAAAVVRFLQTQCKLEPRRLSARGYGQYRPVASNKTAQGRRQNRRIEIILGPLE